MLLKDATLVIKIEREIKNFLVHMAQRKGISTSEYVRFVLMTGLNELERRNKRVRQVATITTTKF
jgi:predicted DNA-binding protein